MISTLVIGDPHFKKDNEEETNELKSEILRVITERDLSYVVVLGDIMHYHSTSYISVFNRACDFINSIADVLPVFVLMGNHDYTSNRVENYKEHFFGNYNRPNVHIIDEPTTDERFKAVFCPYVREGCLEDTFGKELDEMIPHSRIGFFHQEFKHAESRPGVLSEVGDEWPTDAPFAVSGHIHNWHMSQPNVCYTGTPFAHHFGEDTRKTVSIFIYDVNGADHPKQERIELNIPKKIYVRTNCAGFARHVYDNISKIKFKIVDTTRNINSMKKTDKYTTMHMDNRVRITFASKDEEVTPLISTCCTTSTTFKERLYALLDVEQKLLFDEVVDI